MLDKVSQGHYFRKQFGCESNVIAWSHRARFQVGLKLLGTRVGRLLDYGCGDGTFLALAASKIDEGVGADVAVDQLEDCAVRLKEYSHIRFLPVSQLDASHNSTYDVVTCMETLEHCPDPVVQLVLRDLARLVKPGGRVVVSVPIEIGPTFCIKSVLRRLAAWRGLSDYRYYETYSIRNALRMVFANRRTRLDRPLYGPADSPNHSHYGFNWRAMRDQVRAYFEVEKTLFTPLNAPGGLLSSQAWFVCRLPA